MRESIKYQLTNLFTKYLMKQKQINKTKTNLGLSIICEKILEDSVTADDVKEVLEGLGYESIKMKHDIYCFNISEYSVRVLENKANQIK